MSEDDYQSIKRMMWVVVICTIIVIAINAIRILTGTF